MNIIKANGCGNTFLIFDFLDKNDSSHSLNEIQIIHKQQNNIDSCLVLHKKRIINKEKIIINMDVIEINDTKIYDDKFCGNGARVISHYLHQKYPQLKFYFIKKNNKLIELIKKDNLYGVYMGKATNKDSNKYFYKNKKSHITIEFNYNNYNFFYCYINEPHLTTLTPFNNEELYQIGYFINHDINMKKIFPNGINVNTINIINKNTASISTYERGVENLTLACGTGSTAAAFLLKNLSIFSEKTNPINIINRGGINIIKQVKNNFILLGHTEINY